MNKKPTSIKSSEQESFPNVDPANVEIKVDPEQSFSPVDPVDISPEPLNNFSKMPDEYIARNNISDEEILPAKIPEPTERSIAGMPISGTPQKILDDWDAQRPTDVPLVEASALREPSPSYAKVGYPALFGGEYAAIITKVWDSGLVNLIVFSAEHPVSDIKTRVSYGEGPNTWKEIN